MCIRDRYYALDYPKYTFEQIVVIVNEDTASAAEVLAAALAENKHLNVTLVLSLIHI